MLFRSVSQSRYEVDKNKVAKFPGDFTLFEIGVYDRRTGVISMYETKVNLGTALQAKKIKK